MNLIFLISIFSCFKNAVANWPGVQKTIQTSPTTSDTCYFDTSFNQTLVPPANFPVVIKPDGKLETNRFNNIEHFTVPNPMLNFLDPDNKEQLFAVTCNPNDPNDFNNDIDKNCFGIDYMDGNPVLNLKDRHCFYVKMDNKNHELKWDDTDAICVLRTFRIRYCSLKAGSCANESYCDYSEPITFREQCDPYPHYIDENQQTVMQYQPIQNEVYYLQNTIVGTQSGCALVKENSYITDHSGNNITDLVFDDSILPWTVKPSSLNQIDQQYNFTVHLINTWFDKVTSWDYTLNVGCPSVMYPEITGLLLETASSTYSFSPGLNLKLEVNDNGQNIFGLIANQLSLGSYYCAISNYFTIIETSRTSTYGPVTAQIFQSASATNPCPIDNMTNCTTLSVDKTDITKLLTLYGTLLLTLVRLT